MDLQTYKIVSNNKIVHFVAKWCIACAQNKKIFQGFDIDDILIIDVDENPELMEYEKIKKVPTSL